MPLSMDDLMKPPPPTASVYVSGFGKETKEEALLKYFGTIGVIKKHKESGKPDIFLYKDDAGRPWQWIMLIKARILLLPLCTLCDTVLL